jgi:hypothetical protein
MGRKKRWKDLSGKQKLAVTIVGLGQLSLTVAGYRDLAKRPADQIDGPKLAWGVAMLVNWIGPLAYFAKGRKPADA